MLSSCSLRTIIPTAALVCFLSLFAASGLAASRRPKATANGDSTSLLIPIGGNAWVIVPGTPQPEITDSGLVGWKDTATICRIYFRVNQAGSLRLALKSARSGMDSKFRVTCLGKSSVIDSPPVGEEESSAGGWQVSAPGYLFVDVKGVERSDTTFGRLEGLVVSGSAAARMNFVRNNDGNFFYWGRRGPSVHLNYDLRAHVAAEWFYSEVTIPRGGDVIGSFFMANGFSGGYFGMQVNSESERRILFSVWSPFATDDPAAIPPDERIDLLRKGLEVHAGEFGSEGSGGQSYLEYGWKSESTYRFLLHAEPDSLHHTTYTAYFFAPEENSWRLIASFRRPKTSTYLTGLHSFLENFIPETGIVERFGRYGNQWIRDTSGTWHELTRARFSADNTARVGYRLDYAGAVSGAAFALRNCGFFDDFTKIGALLERTASGIPPALELSKLP